MPVGPGALGWTGLGACGARSGGARHRSAGPPPAGLPSRSLCCGRGLRARVAPARSSSSAKDPPFLMLLADLAFLNRCLKPVAAADKDPS